jgi:hypothetical protein
MKQLGSRSRCTAATAGPFIFEAYADDSRRRPALVELQLRIETPSDSSFTRGFCYFERAWELRARAAPCWGRIPSTLPIGRNLY